MGAKATGCVIQAHLFERVTIGWPFGNVQSAPIMGRSASVAIEYSYTAFGRNYKGKSVRSFGTDRAARQYLKHFHEGASLPIRLATRWPAWSAIDPAFPSALGE
jgi:hypothetical protein